jgi:flagellar basal body-associated protein FliL
MGSDKYLYSGDHMRFLALVLLFVLTLVFCVSVSAVGLAGIALLFNAPSIIIVLLPTIGFSILVFSWRTFMLSWGLVFSRSAKATGEEIDDVCNLLRNFGFVSILMGIVAGLVSLILILADLSDPNSIGPNLSVLLLANLYSVGIYILCFEARIHVQNRFRLAEDSQTSIQARPDTKGNKRNLVLAIFIIFAGIGGVAYWTLTPGPDSTGHLSEDQRRARLDQFLEEAEPLYSQEFSYVSRLSDDKNAITISFSMMIKDEKVLEYLYQHQPEIEDIFVSLISGLETLQIRGNSATDSIKQLLLDRINNSIPGQAIDQFAFKDTKPIKKILLSRFLVLPIEKFQQFKEISRKHGQ